MKIDDNLVLFDLEVESKEEVIERLGERLYKYGYVTEDFVTSTLEREKNFPTALPTVPYGVAIPHTDADKVNEAQVVFATLKNPVTFQAMGNAADAIEVKFVFMLALKEPEAQLSMLQNLIGLFQEENTVQQLGDVKDITTFKKLVNFN